MNGLIALVGSGEYLETMEAVDRRLLAQARLASPVNVVCIPAAAGEEGDARVERWMRIGLEHFTRLGAYVQAVRIIDRASADDPHGAALIEAADLIYFSGGNPLYLYQTLIGTRAWAAVESAWTRGATYAGCSAGAMILGAYVPDVRSPDLKVYPAFNWVAHAYILPHFDQLESFRPGATAAIQSRLAEGEFILGIDENTALVGQPDTEWEVLGASRVSLFTRHAKRVYSAGQRLILGGPPDAARPLTV
jgi:cyanophycinase